MIRKQRINKLLNNVKLVQLIAYGKLFQSWVTVQVKEFLNWFVRAKGILNLFPEIFDLNPEGEWNDRRS